LKAIACEILHREACFCAAKSKNIIDIQFVTKGIHDLGGAKMLERLQQEVNAVDCEKYDAIVLVYALCNNGVAGLRAPNIPLVITRAHDCITLLLGSDAKYREFFDRRPGTYFESTGWIERNSTNLEFVSGDIRSQLGYSHTYEDYVKQYGEENAKFIMETLGNFTRNYDCYAYIDMGIQESLGYDESIKSEAAEKGWKFERLAGDLRLIQRLFDCEWDESEFLVVPPHKSIAPAYDGSIVRCE